MVQATKFWLGWLRDWQNYQHPARSCSRICLTRLDWYLCSHRWSKCVPLLSYQDLPYLQLNIAMCAGKNSKRKKQSKNLPLRMLERGFLTNSKLFGCTAHPWARSSQTGEFLSSDAEHLQCMFWGSFFIREMGFMILFCSLFFQHW